MEKKKINVILPKKVVATEKKALVAEKKAPVIKKTEKKAAVKKFVTF